MDYMEFKVVIDYKSKSLLIFVRNVKTRVAFNI